MTQPDGNGWMPIETAPEDGWFLGWNVDDQIWEVWAAKSFRNAIGSWPSMKATGDADPHLLILGLQASAVACWQPLPLPPVTKDTAA